MKPDVFVQYELSLTRMQIEFVCINICTYICAKDKKSVMLGFEGNKEVIKGEEAAMVLARLSGALSGRPSKEDVEAEKSFAKGREMYKVVWK